jgi:hypothetical protein
MLLFYLLNGKAAVVVPNPIVVGLYNVLTDDVGMYVFVYVNCDDPTPISKGFVNALLLKLFD